MGFYSKKKKKTQKSSDIHIVHINNSNLGFDTTIVIEM